jgi:hypothetical protein
MSLTESQIWNNIKTEKRDQILSANMIFLNKSKNTPRVEETRPITMLPHGVKYLEECLK